MYTASRLIFFVLIQSFDSVNCAMCFTTATLIDLFKHFCGAKFMVLHISIFFFLRKLQRKWLMLPFSVDMSECYKILFVMLCTMTPHFVCSNSSHSSYIYKLRLSIKEKFIRRKKFANYWIFLVVDNMSPYFLDAKWIFFFQPRNERVEFWSLTNVLQTTENTLMMSVRHLWYHFKKN